MMTNISLIDVSIFKKKSANIRTVTDLLFFLFLFLFLLIWYDTYKIMVGCRSHTDPSILVKKKKNLYTRVGLLGPR